MTQPWGDQDGGGGFLKVLGISIGAVTASGTQVVPVVLVGGHQRAAGGDGCHALACGLVETSAVTLHGPRCVITGGGDGGARPQSPFAEETTGGCSMTVTLLTVLF